MLITILLKRHSYQFVFQPTYLLANMSIPRRVGSKSLTSYFSPIVFQVLKLTTYLFVSSSFNLIPLPLGRSQSLSSMKYSRYQTTFIQANRITLNSKSGNKIGARSPRTLQVFRENWSPNKWRLENLISSRRLQTVICRSQNRNQFHNSTGRSQILALTSAPIFQPPLSFTIDHPTPVP